MSTINSIYSTPLTHILDNPTTPPSSPSLSYATSYNSNSSNETTFSTSDPFFERIYEHNLAWKHDYITFQNWHSWRVLDDVLRQFKDAGYIVPNMANNNYHHLRNHAIAEYYSRNGPTDELTLNTFIPFIHHAENSNAAVIAHSVPLLELHVRKQDLCLTLEICDKHPFKRCSNRFSLVLTRHELTTDR